MCARSPLTRETLARHSGLADFAFAMQGLGAGPISLVRHASAAQRHGCTRTRSGEAIAAFALTEPASGSDVANITTTARRDGDGYVHRRRKDLDLERRHRRCLRRVRPHRRSAGRARPVGLHRRRRQSGPDDCRAHRHVIAPHPLARLQFNELPRSARRADRRAGRRLQDRDGDARRIPRHRRRSRARLCAPRAR